MKSGIDLTHVADHIRPQDDLYRHLSGRWIETAEIPADRSVDGSFYALRDASEEVIRGIVEAAMASDAPVGSNERAALIAAITSRAAPSMSRLRLNCSVTRDEPAPLEEVISVTSAMTPSRRSSGVATLDDVRRAMHLRGD